MCTYSSSNIPIITDLAGTVKSGGTDFGFEYGTGTQVYLSCSITWKGAFYVFGGSSESTKTQISLVDDCKLTRVGTLPFQLYQGACTNVNNEEFYLCFGLYNIDSCYKGMEPGGSFSSTADSFKHHYKTRIANNQGELSFSVRLITLSRIDSGFERLRPKP